MSTRFHRSVPSTVVFVALMAAASLWAAPLGASDSKPAPLSPVWEPLVLDGEAVGGGAALAD